MHNDRTNGLTTDAYTEGHHHKHICWKSVASGLFVAFIAYMILNALGAGIGGLTAAHIIDKNENGSGLASGAAVWIGVSAAVSLFLGGYFASRTSGQAIKKMGAANGVLIASLFFTLMMFGAGNILGSLTKGVGSLANAIGSGASDVASNEAVQDSVQKAIGTSNLKSEPSDVAQGLIVRLMKGDTTSAKNYLVYQTGQSPSDVEAKVTQLKADFDEAARNAGDAAARGVADAGWSLFVMFIVGLGAAMLGGFEGSGANIRKPVIASRSVDTRNTVVAR